MQRVKVNDKFEFPLELNLSGFLDPESFETSDTCEYELKSIIIHRGGAYGGHYHAFINDEIKEGNWHLEMPEQFLPEPVKIEKKTFNPKDHMTDEQIKKLEEDSLKEGAPLSLDGAGEAKAPVVEEAPKPQATLTKKDRKRLEQK